MKTKNLLTIFIISLILIVGFLLLLHNYEKNDENGTNEQVNLDNTIKISYVGDLILLKDQVISSKINDGYDFDYMFRYAKRCFDSSDYTIGVLEGPSVDNKDYSTSNFDDGIKLYLNYPTDFIKAIKNAGIDFVTTANNHMLDVGLDSALETLDNLEKYEMAYTGTYRNEEEYHNVKIVEVKGIKIALLAYSYGSNYIEESYFFEEQPYFSKMIVDKSSPYFEKSKKIVIQDLKKARENADIIIVMPHMGTQFMHTTNSMQDRWNKIFAENGADIILGDHSHATQNIEYIGDTLVVNCPGNFANSYISFDGDATSIVNVYIDKETKKVVTSSIIPMITYEISKNKFSALPIYDIYMDDHLKDFVRVSSLNRVDQVLSIVTKSMIGKEITKDQLQKEYFVTKNKYIVDMEVSKKNSKFYHSLKNSRTVTFIGDSITEGTKNDGHPYYEPIVEDLKKLKVFNISEGGSTVKSLYRKYYSDLQKVNSDIVVIALGCNDIRYRNENSAFTSEEYIEYMNKIIDLIIHNNSESKIFILAPWPSLDYDKLSKANLLTKNLLYEDYISSIENEYKDKENIIFINQYLYLKQFFGSNNAFEYLTDQIHPNHLSGIRLYSKAILETY